jgi:DNA gyrase subunit A
VGMVVVRPESTLLVVTERGMGKRSDVEEYRLQQRGGKGVINLRVTDKTGRVVSIKAVGEQEQLMVMTRNGVVNRQAINEIRVIGRATQGVRLVNLDEGDLVMDVARIVVEENGDALAQAEAAAEEINANGGPAAHGEAEPVEDELGDEEPLEDEGEPEE